MATKNIIRVLMVAVLAFAARPASATPLVITFNDLTDTLTVTGAGDTGRLSFAGGLCHTEATFEECTAELVAPAGYSFGSATVTQGAFYLVGESSLTSGFVSDKIYGSGTLVPGTFYVLFQSDRENTFGSCAAAFPCQFIETGTPQLFATVTWTSSPGASPGAPIVDSVMFQSDAEPVPEPATLGLLAIGLGAASRRLRTRRN